MLTKPPLIIDSTPTGKLESDIREILAEASKNANVNIKLVVRGGRKIVKNAPSDPFASRLCSRPQCKVCTSTDSMGGCKQASIGYTLTCNPCAEADILATYQGESSKSAFERGDQHAKGLVKKADDNPIWKHSELHHDSDNKIGFTMKVTGRFAKPMIRQENEAIRIRESEAVHEMNSRSEFHQPVIVRLVPTSSISQLDQAGTPAPIMDARQYNKRKFSHVSRPDSPNVESRSKFSKSSYTDRSNPSNHVSRRDQHFQPTIVTTTRKQRNTSAGTNSESYYVQPNRVQSSSNTNQHHSSDSYHSPKQHSNHSRTYSSTSGRRSSTSSRHRAVTPHRVSKSPVSPMPVQTNHHKNPTNHMNHTRTVHWADRNITPPRAHSTGRSVTPAPNNSTSLSNTTHIDNISMSPVSPDNFSFAMQKLRSKGKFAYRLDNTRSKRPTNSSNITNTVRSSSEERRYLDRIGAVSRSVMRNHPSTLDNVVPVLMSPIAPTLVTHTDSNHTNILSLSPVSQFPLTQAVQTLQSNTKVVAKIRQTSHPFPTINTFSSNEHNELPILSQELSVEFDTSLNDDDFNSIVTTNVEQRETISQLETRAAEALELVDIREEQVKHALDNPITTLEGLNNLRERRRREATVTYKPFSTLSTGACRLSPQKPKNKSKSKNTPNNSKKTLFSKISPKTTFPHKKSTKKFNTSPTK